MVVYGDNKSELLFDFFCEKNMLSLFLEIMWTEGGCPPVVHIQILQTLSILINCVRNDTSLYYLLSNNYINEIIIYPFAFATDENLCDQFASFMKSLSLKLNIQTVQFFFIEETGAFPILTRAIGLLDVSSEPMVRISSQSTILNVYKVEDSRAREYALQEEVMHSLFVNIVSLMRSQHSTISSICVAYQTESDELKQNKLENQLEDILASTEDWFYYLQDILDLKILALRQALIHHLLNEFVYPVLLLPLTKYRAAASATATADSPVPGATGKHLSASFPLCDHHSLDFRRSGDALAGDRVLGRAAGEQRQRRQQQQPGEEPTRRSSAQRLCSGQTDAAGAGGDERLDGVLPAGEAAPLPR